MFVSWPSESYHLLQIAIVEFSSQNVIRCRIRIIKSEWPILSYNYRILTPLLYPLCCPYILPHHPTFLFYPPALSVVPLDCCIHTTPPQGLLLCQ